MGPTWHWLSQSEHGRPPPKARAFFLPQIFASSCLEILRNLQGFEYGAEFLALRSRCEHSVPFFPGRGERRKPRVLGRKQTVGRDHRGEGNEFQKRSGLRHLKKIVRTPRSQKKTKPIEKPEKERKSKVSKKAIAILQQKAGIQTYFLRGL